MRLFVPIVAVQAPVADLQPGILLLYPCMRPGRQGWGQQWKRSCYKAAGTTVGPFKYFWTWSQFVTCVNLHVRPILGDIMVAVNIDDNMDVDLDDAMEEWTLLIAVFSKNLCFRSLSTVFSHVGSHPLISLIPCWLHCKIFIIFTTHSLKILTSYPCSLHVIVLIPQVFTGLIVQVYLLRRK